MKKRLVAQSVLRHLSRRHCLPPAPPASSPLELVERLVALHATDPSTVHLSTFVRSSRQNIGETAAELRDALEEKRSLVRWIAMRRTLHVVSSALLPVVLAVYRERLSRQLRSGSARLLAEAGVCDPEAAEAELDRLEAEVVQALRGAPAPTTELAQTIPELRAAILYKPDKPYGSRLAIGGHLLNAFGVFGLLVRANTQGGWRSGRFSWARLDRWLPSLARSPELEEAHALLVRAYVGGFGPASFEDLHWWTGLPKGTVRKALAACGGEILEVEVGGWKRPQLVLAGDLEGLRRPLSRDSPGAALLPALDPTVMGYKERGRFLDPAWKEQLFDRNGNAGPTVWWDGRVIGGWAQRKDGRIVWRLLKEEPRAEPSVRRAAAALEEALGEERVMPRFPNPLHKTLIA